MLYSMSQSPTAYSFAPPSKNKQYKLNKSMQAKATALNKLFKAQNIPLYVTYTSWEDAMRAWNSALGSNIADLGLVFRTLSGETVSEQEVVETYGFKCRSSNFDEMLVEIDSRKFKIIVSDSDGRNPRSMILSDALKQAGSLFKDYGLPEDCDLYDPSVDNKNVKLRIDIIFAPNGAAPALGSFATKEFALTKYSYQAKTGDARNINLLAHPQGTACSDDTSDKQYLRPQCKGPDGAMNDFWFEAEDTGKSVQDMHTETTEESAQAAARGKGTAVRSGCDGWDKLFNTFHFIQVPRKQEYQDEDDDESKFLSKGCKTFLKPKCKGGSGGSDSDCKGGSDSDSEEGPVLRSCGSSSLSSAPDYRSGSSSLSSARVSRGTFAGKSFGVQSKTVQRAKGEPITITSTMVIMMDGDGPPPVGDIQHLWKTIDRMMKIAGGEPKNLHDPTAKLTTGAELTKTDMDKIEKKQKTNPAPPQKPPMPVAPIVGVPMDL